MSSVFAAHALCRNACSFKIPGSRLQSIAEMGEWVVFREKKPKARPESVSTVAQTQQLTSWAQRPFFWNMSTGEKSWEAPVILQAPLSPTSLERRCDSLPLEGQRVCSCRTSQCCEELGVADTLLKWSEDPCTDFGQQIGPIPYSHVKSDSLRGQKYLPTKMF